MDRMPDQSMDTAVLNKGLAFAMEFGANWLKPIQERLAKLYPQLSQPELDEYERICREAMTFGHTQLVSCWRDAGANQMEALLYLRRDVLARFPWVSDINLDRLFSQGCYYAHKNGEI